MDASHSSSAHRSRATTERPKPSFWRKLGGGSLSISLIVHGIILAIGIVWVVAIIPAPPEKKVDFMPSGGGGGSPAASEVKNKKRNMSLQSNAPRMAAVGAESKFALPEPDTSSEMTSLGALGGGGLSAGLGGNGSGGGKGNGTGKGFGNGMGPGMGGGNALANPFGMVDANANALVGELYDLKQTKDRKPTGIDAGKFLEEMRTFAERGWKPRSLDNYYKAPQKLYLTRVYMPLMDAGGAPQAFNCEKEVQPKLWAVIYRGTVTPPKTAKYRFVGAADDTLLVRFNGRHVLDYGFTQLLSGVSMMSADTRAVFMGKTENRDLMKRFRDSPMRPPVTYYQYPETANWNHYIGGMAVGAEFEARAGTSYPIEIMMTEFPGGWFNASLMIEEVGATYQKSSTGSPILPLFRTDSSLPVVKPGDQNVPPIDAQAPPWKITGRSGGLDI